MHVCGISVCRSAYVLLVLLFWGPNLRALGVEPEGVDPVHFNNMTLDTQFLQFMCAPGRVIGPYRPITCLQMDPHLEL